MTLETIDLQHPGVFLELNRFPSLGPVFTKVLLLSLVKSQGRLNRNPAPRITLFTRAIQPDPARITAFRHICRYPAGSALLPMIYPETLFIGMLGKMIISPFFPVSPLGLIHIGQKVIQLRPIGQDEVLDARCTLDDVAQTEKGIRMICRLEVMSGQERVWEGNAVFLSRARITPGSEKPRPAPETDAMLPVTEILDVPQKTGLAYAAASGDYNPHHLYPFTAKLLGFRQPIAHGMWTLSRAISALEQTSPLFYPVRVDAAFKLPIYMPARVTLGCEKKAGLKREDQIIDFEVRDQVRRLPHVIGTLISGYQAMVS
ncbi:MAG: MaoC family dehydratase [Pseudomonadota bacterium]